MQKIVKSFLDEVGKRNQNEPEFMQAVTEVAETVIPYIYQNEISELIGIDISVTSVTLKILERKKYISRKILDDNRKKMVKWCW